MDLQAADALRSFIPGWLKKIGSQALTSNTIGALIKNQGWVRSKSVTIFVNHPRIANTEAASIYFGIRERAEVDLVNNMLSIDRYSTVIELGSSIGVVSANIARHSPQCMICLEADPELMEICQLNVKRNATESTETIFLNKVIDYSDATKSVFKVGKTTTSGKLHDKSSAAAPSSLVEHSVGQTSVQREVLLSLPSTTLSRIINQYEINEYILISDIEGSEADVWFSDAAALQHCQAIVAELEDTPTYSTQDQIGKLHSLGFATRYRYGRVYLFNRVC